MSSLTPLAQHHAEKHKNQLARALSKRKQEGVTIIDSSFVANYVGRRLYGPHELFTLSELWQIEGEFKRNLLAHMDERMSFTGEMRTEDAYGSDHLRNLVEDPIAALRFRWNKPIRSWDLVEEPENKSRASSKSLREFLGVTRETTALFHALPTEAYLMSTDPARLAAVNEAVRPFAPAKSSHNSTNSSQSDHLFHDVQTFGAALALSYNMPVDLLAGDSDFLQIHQAVYADNQAVLRTNGLPRPDYPITMIIDIPKRPWIERAPGY